MTITRNRYRDERIRRQRDYGRVWRPDPVDTTPVVIDPCTGMDFDAWDDDPPVLEANLAISAEGSPTRNVSLVAPELQAYWGRFREGFVPFGNKVDIFPQDATHPALLYVEILYKQLSQSVEWQVHGRPLALAVSESFVEVDGYLSRNRILLCWHSIDTVEVVDI